MAKDAWWRRWKRAQSPTEAESRPAEPLTPTDRERLAQLESEISQMRLEWAETLDKINRWASRQAARTRHELARALDSAEAVDANQQTPTGPVDKNELRRSVLSRLRQGRVG